MASCRIPPAMPHRLSVVPKLSNEAALAAASLRVVVIDDDPDAVLMLLSLLRTEGYNPTGFGSARAAIRALPTLDPDVVISDVSMPFMNGWDLAREIRQIMGERPTLIGISGQYMRGPDKVLAELAGFNFYLTKPCDPKELMALLAPLGANKQRYRSEG
jgi:CheY-like chemotaxis protein